MEHFTTRGKIRIKTGLLVSANRMIADDWSVKRRPLFHFLSTVGKPQATCRNDRVELQLNNNPPPPSPFLLCALCIVTSRPEVTSEDLMNQRRGLGLSVEPVGVERKKDLEVAA